MSRDILFLYYDKALYFIYNKDMFENTKLVYKKLIHDIDISIHVVDIIIQVIFLGFYAYYGVTYFEEFRPLFYLYASLFGLGTIWLFITIFRFKFEKQKRKLIGKIVKYTKWGVRFLIICLNVYFAIAKGVSDLRMILIVLSIFFLLGQIIFELIARFVRHYYELMVHSFMKDAEELVDNAPTGLKVVDKVFRTGFREKIKDFANKHKRGQDTEDKLNKIKRDNIIEEVYNDSQSEKKRK